MAGPLPERAADTTAEQPWPVRVLSLKIQDYVDKMSVTWVEGQVVQLNRRPGSRYAYLTLRDPDVDMSLSCSVQVNALDAMPTPLTQGARVVVQAKPSYGRSPPPTPTSTGPSGRSWPRRSSKSSRTQNR